MSSSNMRAFQYCILRFSNGYLCNPQTHKLIFAARFKSDTNIMKFLNVAEKNDAAKNIAGHLSRGTSRRREGYSVYNKIYEFEAEVRGQNCAMIMTSVSGHLLNYDFVGAYKSWHGCNPVALFEAPVFKFCPENLVKVKKTLEREIRGCDGLIIWTDCDREGENIGFEIIQVCTAIKSNLRIYRAKFSEITAISVRRALQNLGEPDKNVSDAVDVRQELDLRIGAAFTRFQTLRLQKVFPQQLTEKLVSYGSCQFPTLGFVVERYRAVENFISEPFWKIKVNHTINGLSVDFSWERIRLFDEAACRVLHEMCVEEPEARVLDVKTKPKSKWRPLPLDTVELEKLASRKLKINAKETMRIAEKLYTQGFISYPRTETNQYPSEMNLAQLVGLQAVDPQWGPFAQGILDGGGPTPRQGTKTDKAHPPIHPTKYTNSLSGIEQRLYEFIVRSFLACCSKDAQGQETSVLVAVAGERFIASGLMITARHYLEVYPYDKWSAKEIHVYESGQTFNPTSIDLVDGATSPPNLLTEADLIALMEKHGIGTDATHAEHIETIKARSYVALADAIHFVPGLLGMGLVEGYDSMGLTVAKPDLRAGLEADLKAICEGRKEPQSVLAEQIAKYKAVYMTVSAEALKIDAALAQRFSARPQEYAAAEPTMPDSTPVFKCPKCNMDMIVRKKRDTEECFISCSSFPACKNAVWFPGSLVHKFEVTADTCSHCGPQYKKLRFHWKTNTVNHLYPPPYTGCIGGCDETFLDVLKVNPSSVRPSAANNRPSSVANNRPNIVNQNIPNSTTQNRPRNDNTQTNVGTQNRVTSSNQNSQINTINQNRPNPSRNERTSDDRSQNRANAISSWLTPSSEGTQPRTSDQGWNVRPNLIDSHNVPRVQRPHSGDDGDNSVMCSCNQEAILLTVKKQNENFGKKFYKCSTPREGGGCNFFLWAPDAVVPNVDTPPNSASVEPPSLASTWGATVAPGGWGDARTTGADDDIVCRCGLLAKKLTVHKEGSNRGREFYSCTKDMSLRCDFFQWADSGPPATSSWGESSGGYTTTTRGRGQSRGGRSNRGGASRGGGASGGGARAPRRCTNCKQEGHTRNRCPDLQ